VEELQRDPAVELGVVREHDHAHPAGAEGALDDVAVDALPGSRRAAWR
jgi:hypothetical protein